jgi:hypothetical protein
VSFVYNNKLPFYVWGDLGNPFNFLRNEPEKHWINPHYQLKSRRVHLSVPLPEYGARRSWENKSGQNITANLSIQNTSDFEGVPCDAQLPWKMFQQGTGSGVWGLTIYGEVYFIPAGLSFSWIASAPENQFWAFSQLDHSALCRMSRWQSAAVTKPIQSLFAAGELYPNSVIAVDRDGDAWWLHDWRKTTSDILNNRIGDSATAIELPQGKKAKFITYASLARGVGGAGTSGAKLSYILTTTENKTYIRAADESDWYALTTGCVEILGRPDLVNFTHAWNADDLPVAAVSAPDQAGGATAQVSIEYGPAYVENGISYKPFESLKIDNPGSGYTADATVSFSRPPDSKSANAPELDFKLMPWSNYIVGYMSSQTGRQSNSVSTTSSSLLVTLGNKLFFTVQVHSPSLVDNAGKTVVPTIKPTAFCHWVYSGFNVFTNIDDDSSAVPVKITAISNSPSPIRQFALSQDGKLYKDRSDALGQWELVDNGPWVSLTASGRTYCAVKQDGTMWTWGRNSDTEPNGNFTAPRNFYGVFFGDGSQVDAQRTTPTQIASEAAWVSVWPLERAGFIAIRKDAICRDIDQPMEYWPDWHFGG